MIVFGVDILKGSSHSKDSARYALYVIEDGSEWSKEVSKNRLFRFIREKKPDFIAIDNVFELFKDKRELVNFLRFIPPNTKLIQTAGKISLPKLSRRYGIEIHPRNPFDEARASALLAKYGVGEVVSVFIDKTIIKVSRNRSLGKGGWRQNKYRRKVHDAVRRVYKEIKDVLDAHGLDYVEEIREGYGGISRGIFVVNEVREKVPVNSFKQRDVQVKVEAVEKDKIEFIPMRKQRNYLIVGIDPGATIGVAILDLNGNVIAIKSQKSWSYSEVVDYILSYGKPIVIATDKKNVPDYVNKLKASFNCILYNPKEDLSVEKKKNLVSGYKILNDHERDALASALDAYNSYKNKLQNVEKRIPKGYDIEEIKAGIIKGLSLKSLLEVKEEKKSEEAVKESFDYEEIKRRDRIIAELREENSKLYGEIKRLNKEIERLRTKIYTISSEEYKKIREENVIKSMQFEIKTLRELLKKKDKEVRELREKLDELRKVKYLEFKGWKAIKVLRKFTKDDIEKLERDMGIGKGDVIYIEDVSGAGKSGAEMLVNHGIKALIARGDMSHLAKEVLEREKIPVIPSEKMEIKIFEDFALVKAEELERCVNEALNEIEKRSLKKLEDIILEYKNRRQFEFEN